MYTAQSIHVVYTRHVRHRAYTLEDRHLKPAPTDVKALDYKFKSAVVRKEVAGCVWDVIKFQDKSTFLKQGIENPHLYDQKNGVPHKMLLKKSLLLMVVNQKRPCALSIVRVCFRVVKVSKKHPLGLGYFFELNMFHLSSKKSALIRKSVSSTTMRTGQQKRIFL